VTFAFAFGLLALAGRLVFPFALGDRLAFAFVFPFAFAFAFVFFGFFGLFSFAFAFAFADVFVLRFSFDSSGVASGDSPALAGRLTSIATVCPAFTTSPARGN
jgi:hypothetical protein